MVFNLILFFHHLTNTILLSPIIFYFLHWPLYLLKFFILSIKTCLLHVASHNNPLNTHFHDVLLMFAALYRSFLFQPFLCDETPITQPCPNFATDLIILKAEACGCPLWPAVLAPGLKWDNEVGEQNSLEYVCLGGSTLQDILLWNTTMG